MKLPLASEGKKEMSIAVVVSAGWAIPWVVSGFWPMALPAVPLLGAVLMFFRDPSRRIPSEQGVLVAAADGRVTHVERVENDPIIGRPAVRISTFLSIADVHINRAPCAGQVVATKLREGRFLDARDERCAAKNACNTVVLAPHEPVQGPVIVKQLAGMIARRIVCNVKSGDRLAAGQKFGMIKFGSRTDVIIPEQPGLEVLAQVGQKMHAGMDILARIVQPQMQNGRVELPCCATAERGPSMCR